MFSRTLTFATIVASAMVTASPVPRSTCGTSTYGPFKLFAQQGSGDAQIVRLVNMGLDSNNNPKSTMTVCETCGDVPAYWQLTDSVLTAYLFDVVEGQVTVNMPLSQGKVNFVTGDESSVVKPSNYCAVRNSSAGGLPGFLAVDGDADGFSICAFLDTPGRPSHRRDIYFKQVSNLLAYNCQAAHLIMQSTGIIAEPIPAN